MSRLFTSFAIVYTSIYIYIFLPATHPAIFRAALMCLIVFSGIYTDDRAF